MLDCGRTGIPAGVLPAIAPGSRPGLTERLAGAPDDESRTKAQHLHCNSVHQCFNQCVPSVSKSPVVVWTSTGVIDPASSSTHFRRGDIKGIVFK